MKNSISAMLAFLMLCFFCAGICQAEEKAAEAKDSKAVPKAFVDGKGPGWVALGGKDFGLTNCDAGTWVFKDGKIHCTGKPVGVIRSKKQFTNFELVVEWNHLKPAGNSGVFLWAPEKVFKDLKRNTLPKGGIEIQMLEHAYKANYEKRGKKANWFTTNGDVFSVGSSSLKPFAPVSPNGRRSFPRKDLSRGVGEWNHYYVRAINGEVRLWVNGEEVSGGKDAKPASGYLCLESEGSPIEFKGLRIRELP